LTESQHTFGVIAGHDRGESPGGPPLSFAGHRCNLLSAKNSLQIAKILAKQKIKDTQKYQIAR